jgi:hypothetical protein
MPRPVNNWDKARSSNCKLQTLAAAHLDTWQVRREGSGKKTAVLLE